MVAWDSTGLLPSDVKSLVVPVERATSLCPVMALLLPDNMLLRVDTMVDLVDRVQTIRDPNKVILLQLCTEACDQYIEIPGDTNDISYLMVGIHNEVRVEKPQGGADLAAAKAFAKLLSFPDVWIYFRCDCDPVVAAILDSTEAPNIKAKVSGSESAIQTMFSVGIDVDLIPGKTMTEQDPRFDPSNICLIQTEAHPAWCFRTQARNTIQLNPAKPTLAKSISPLLDSVPYPTLCVDTSKIDHVVKEMQFKLLELTSRTTEQWANICRECQDKSLDYIVDSVNTYLQKHPSPPPKQSLINLEFQLYLRAKVFTCLPEYSLFKKLAILNCLSVGKHAKDSKKFDRELPPPKHFPELPPNFVWKPVCRVSLGGKVEELMFKHADDPTKEPVCFALGGLVDKGLLWLRYKIDTGERWMLKPNDMRSLGWEFSLERLL
eukprot:TRINITY_DN66634_c7_g11_i1.p1 TRINITY_DN66634_c7_g11~~TRINITY_DN66634_c7_g11_i1.p1  ORF type:complete len:444 (-),score=0.67 TRINITY_DN66634_c7_g11_i1:246-1547(-)